MISKPLAIPEADNGEEPHIHREASPHANSQAAATRGSSTTPSRRKSSSLAQLSFKAYFFVTFQIRLVSIDFIFFL
jgi:hypothetical protein